MTLAANAHSVAAKDRATPSWGGRKGYGTLDQSPVLAAMEPFSVSDVLKRKRIQSLAGQEKAQRHPLTNEVGVFMDKLS